MRDKITAHLFTIYSIIVWGTTFLSTKVLLRSFDPVIILIYRLVVCLTLLMIISPKIYKLKCKKDELLFLGAGASGICFYFLFENIALKYTSTTNVGIIVSMAPMFTMLFCSIVLKNSKIKLNFILGFIVAIIGVILISLNGKKSLGLSPKGDILAVCAMVMWGIYSVFVSLITNRGYSGIGCTRKIMYYGLICIIPFIFIFRSSFNINRVIEYKNLLNILYLGICASGIAFILWNNAVKELGPIKTTIYLYVSPAITLIASVIIIHDRINALSILGLILSVLGLFISGDVWKRKKSNNIEENS